MSTLYPQSEVKVVKVDFVAKSIEPEKIESGDRGKWRAIRGVLREADPDIFRNWYDKLIFKGCLDGNLVLAAPNPFIARHIETHLNQELLGAAKGIFGDSCIIKIETVR